MSNSIHFSHWHQLKFDLKVSQMGWVVKIEVVSQPKHGLWPSKMKTGKYLPGG